jgi:heptosyltransferase-2
VAKLGLRPHTAKIGIVTGRGAGFCGKSLPEGYYIEIIDSLNKLGDVEVLLLGGPREKDINKRILSRVSSKVIDTGCDNSIGQYAGIIDLCDMIITGDTLTLHLAIALKKQVVVFFGSTARQEIELYERGMKILPDIGCSPCYKKDCSIGEECMKQITPARVVDAVKKLLKDNSKVS